MLLRAPGEKVAVCCAELSPGAERGERMLALLEWGGEIAALCPAALVGTWPCVRYRKSVACVSSWSISASTRFTHCGGRAWVGCLWADWCFCLAFLSEVFFWGLGLGDDATTDRPTRPRYRSMLTVFCSGPSSPSLGAERLYFPCQPLSHPRDPT